MKDIVRINDSKNAGKIHVIDRDIERVFYKDVAVITFRMVDDVHDRKEGSAKRAFYKNRERFIPGEDYFEAPYKDWSRMVVTFSPCQKQKGGHKGSMILLTESGYLLVAKTFNDDRAWAVQRALVNSYFSMKRMMGRPAPEFTEAPSGGSLFPDIPAELIELSREAVKNPYVAALLERIGIVPKAESKPLDIKPGPESAPPRPIPQPAKSEPKPRKAHIFIISPGWPNALALTSGAVARILGIDPSTVRKFKRRGFFDGYMNKNTADFAISGRDLQRWIARRALEKIVDMPDLMTGSKAARLLCVSASAIRYHIREGHLRGVKKESIWHVEKDSLLDLLAQWENPNR